MEYRSDFSSQENGVHYFNVRKNLNKTEKNNTFEKESRSLPTLITRNTSKTEKIVNKNKIPLENIYLIIQRGLNPIEQNYFSVSEVEHSENNNYDPFQGRDRLKENLIHCVYQEHNHVENLIPPSQGNDIKELGDVLQESNIIDELQNF